MTISTPPPPKEPYILARRFPHFARVLTSLMVHSLHGIRSFFTFVRWDEMITLTEFVREKPRVDIGASGVNGKWEGGNFRQMKTPRLMLALMRPSGGESESPQSAQFLG